MLFSYFTERRYYLWFLLIALVLRIIWAIAVPVVPVSDSNAYDVFAQNLANCQNYGWDCTTPSAYWPVGTSWVYSLLYQVFGHQYLPIIVLNLILEVLTIGVAMYLAEIWFSQRIAAWAGILLAIWPSQIQFTTVLASEQPFTALTMIALAVWEQKSLNLWLKALFVGILLAAASYVRPTALLLPALLLFLRYMSTREVMRSIASIALVWLVMAVLIAPWSIRNTQEFGQFITISTNGGANMWMGNNPESTGEYMDFPAAVKDMNEAQRDKYLKALAVAHIKEKPVLFATRVIQRIINTHSRETISIGWNEKGLVNRYGHWILSPLKILNQLYWIVILGLGLVGIGLLGKQYGLLTMITHPTVLVWGYFTAIHAIIVAQDRYHFPSIPMISILASFALVNLVLKPAIKFMGYSFEKMES